VGVSPTILPLSGGREGRGLIGRDAGRAAPSVIPREGRDGRGLIGRGLLLRRTPAASDPLFVGVRLRALAPGRSLGSALWRSGAADRERGCQRRMNQTKRRGSFAFADSDPCTLSRLLRRAQRGSVRPTAILAQSEDAISSLSAG
jgi:hypothetical protein